MADISVAEQTTHDGSPRELYYFKLAGATSRHYTSASEDVVANLTVATTYAAIAGLRRSGIVSEPGGDAPAIEVTLPFDVSLIDDLLFKMPPREAKLIIYRTHGATATLANSFVYWYGHLTRAKVSGRVVTFVVPSLLKRSLDNEIPSYVFQAQCNRVLFDRGCGIDRTAWDVATTATVVDGDVVTVASDGGAADGAFNGGSLVRDTDGERRLIVSHVGNVMTLIRPFRELVVGNNVTAYQGCAHTREVCLAKFNNLVNFFGWPDINGANPFEQGSSLTGKR